jgi:hypothetical protein
MQADNHSVYINLINIALFKIIEKRNIFTLEEVGMLFQKLFH